MVQCGRMGGGQATFGHGGVHGGYVGGMWGDSIPATTHPPPTHYKPPSRASTPASIRGVCGGGFDTRGGWGYSV